MSVVVVLVALAWIACGTLTFGIVMAYSWHKWPVLRSESQWMEDKGVALFFALTGPLGLGVTFLMSGLAHYGLLYRRPKVSR